MGTIHVIPVVEVVSWVLKGDGLLCSGCVACIAADASPVVQHQCRS